MRTSPTLCQSVTLVPLPFWVVHTAASWLVERPWQPAAPPWPDPPASAVRGQSGPAAPSPLSPVPAAVCMSCSSPPGGALACCPPAPVSGCKETQLFSEPRRRLAAASPQCGLEPDRLRGWARARGALPPPPRRVGRKLGSPGQRPAGAPGWSLERASPAGRRGVLGYTAGGSGELPRLFCCWPAKLLEDPGCWPPSPLDLPRLCFSWCSPSREHAALLYQQFLVKSLPGRSVPHQLAPAGWSSGLSQHHCWLQHLQVLHLLEILPSAEIINIWFQMAWHVVFFLSNCVVNSLFTQQYSSVVD